MLISEDEYLDFVDRALDGMAQVLSSMGDELANRRPALPGANSPYAIVTHCLGVLDYWAGFQVAGRSVERDRDREFSASGPVHELLVRVEAAKRQLRGDLALADPSAPIRAAPPPLYLGTRPVFSQGGALFHAYADLAQHHGQLELTRDFLLATPDATHEP
jgi:hypothetical protein